MSSSIILWVAGKRCLAEHVWTNATSSMRLRVSHWTLAPSIALLTTDMKNLGNELVYQFGIPGECAYVFVRI